MNDILSHLEDAGNFFNSFLLPPVMSITRSPQPASITLFNGIGDIQVVERGEIVVLKNSAAVATCALPIETPDPASQDAVIYVPNIIAIAKKTTSFGLSFDFSGCLMAQFTIGGQKYIAHISTTNSTQGFDCKDEFICFLNIINNLSGPVQNLVLFKPDFDLSDFASISNNGTYSGHSAWGVIDNNNRCYSLSVAKDENLNYRLFTIRKITKPLSTSLIDLRSATSTGWNTYLKRQKVDLLWKFK